MRGQDRSGSFLATLLAGLCWTSLHGCNPAGNGGGNAVPLEPWVAVHTKLTLTAELGGLEELAAPLHLLLDLEPGEGDVQGTIYWYDEDLEISGGMGTVTGMIEGSRVTLDAGSVTWGANDTLSWTELRLTLRDTDGDGIADSGSGHTSGDMVGAWGDDQIWFSLGSSVDADPDVQALEADLRPAESEPASTMLETGGFIVRFNKPVLWEEIQREVAILADGEPLDGEPEPVNQADDWAMGFTFRPEARLDFSAEITLDPGAITDRLGNAASCVSEPLQTPDDPGPLTGNPDFEDGLANWLVEGDVEAVGTYEIIEPASGEQQVVMASYGSIAGYIDVPAEASQLSFSATVLTETDGQFTPPEAYVWLNAAGEDVQVLEVRDETPEACDCGEFAGIIRLPRVEVDLTPYRGLRVFVTAASLVGWDATPYYSALVLDDFQVE